MQDKKKKFTYQHYDGYSSCPMFVGDNRLMMIEFKYNGVPSETFSRKHQITPSRLFFYMKKYAFPYCYWKFMPKGKWFGCRMTFKPKWL